MVFQGVSGGPKQPKSGISQKVFILQVSKGEEMFSQPQKHNFPSFQLKILRFVNNFPKIHFEIYIKKIGHFLDQIVYSSFQSDLSQFLVLYYNISQLDLFLAEMNDFSVKKTVSLIFEALDPISGFLGGPRGSKISQIRIILKSMHPMGF